MVRRRYVYRRNEETGALESVEVPTDWEDVPRAPLRVDVSYMDGAVAPDGTDLSSKAKRREYFRLNNVTDASDFTNHWADAAKKREAYYSGKAKNPQLREAIGRTAYAMEMKRGRRK